MTKSAIAVASSASVQIFQAFPIFKTRSRDFGGLGHGNKAERNRGKCLIFQPVGEARIRFGVPRDSLARDGCDGMSHQLEAPIV